MSIENLRQELDRALVSFDKESKFKTDPLDLFDKSLSPDDLELVSFLIAGLSYGRVEQIQKSSVALLTALTPLGIDSNGAGIANFLKNWNDDSHSQVLSVLGSWKHRLNTPQDIASVFYALAMVLKKHPSLCALYQKTYKENPRAHIENFTETLWAFSESKKGAHKEKKKWSGTQAQWFAPTPSQGSTCKRLMMWLRWMIRPSAPDLGVWQSPALHISKAPAPSTARLFVPVDTHIFQWAQNHGVLSTRGLNWKCVEEITSFFKELNPDDPLKYDFMLCHEGMENFRFKVKQKSKIAR